MKLSSDVKKFAEEVGQNEQDHVDALKGAITKLGGKPAATPTFTFPLKDEKSFMDLSVTFEDTGVSAYNGAGPMRSSPRTCWPPPAASSRSKRATREPFATSRACSRSSARSTRRSDMDKVLTAVKPFIKA